MINGVFEICFQLGAVEFLQKPLSEDKLRNIWQHVVHKVCLDSGDKSSGLTIMTKGVR